MSYCVYLLEDCNGLGYIGSTRYLKRRLAQHNNNTYNYCKSNLLAKPFNHLVLEKFDNEDSMLVGEQFYIKLYKSLYGDKLLNKAIPLQTDKEYYYKNREKLLERGRERYNENKDIVLEYHKIYRETHIDESKAYYQRNKDRKIAYRKKYYQEHKQKEREYMREYHKIIECECGSTTTNKAQHLKTKKHQNFLNQIKN
jgi:predicted GIY-YIG superfamily endonuclease